MARGVLHGALVAALLTLVTGGCSRKAPGPQDCYRFALSVVGVTDQRMLRSPPVRAAVDQLTNRCLTTPFDRQLISCVNRFGNVRQCYAAFQARHAAQGAGDHGM